MTTKTYEKQFYEGSLQHYNSTSRINNQIDNLTVHLKQLEIEGQKQFDVVMNYDIEDAIKSKRGE